MAKNKDDKYDGQPQRVKTILVKRRLDTATDLFHGKYRGDEGACNVRGV